MPVCYGGQSECLFCLLVHVRTVSCIVWTCEQGYIGVMGDDGALEGLLKEETHWPVRGEGTEKQH